ncbi:hypothetical protein KVP09_06495 [Alcaligenaceae bacterium CGII-47]|nr:hypothetical protein [Alcaligenaceae bacterium CGII-47]
MYLRSPVYGLLAAFAYCLATSLAAIVVATSQPWLGLELTAQADESVHIQDCHAPCAGIDVHAVLVGIRPAGAKDTLLEVTVFDLTEEPDILPDARAMDQFFGRQQQRFEVLNAPVVEVAWQGVPGADIRLTSIQPDRRPWTSLPPMFWFQLLVACLGCLIASWVWVLKPRDFGTRLFAVTGFAFPVFALPAAIYSTRELALSAGLFNTLSLLNYLGALVYGAAFAAIFLAHPRRIASPIVLAAFPIAGVIWWIPTALGIVTDPDLSVRFPTLFLMLAAVVFAAIQWRLSRFQLTDRAALRWLLLSLLLGAGLYITNQVVSSILGWAPPIPQGYAFGFFLIIYLGIALGLRRYRLFDLDVWAYRLLLSIGTLLVILLADAALITLMGWSSQTALATSIWVTGLLYFPVRQWLWARMSGHGRIGMDQVLPQLVKVAFEPAAHTRGTRWRELLHTLYNPLQIEAVTSDAPASDQVMLEQDGAMLRVPAMARLPALRLIHRSQARRLFSSADKHFVAEMCHLLSNADASRSAFEDAIHQERRRIARDLHDDVGARLLMLIHRAPTKDIADLARHAMGDLRSALSAIDAQPSRLSECLADWRAEAQTRCDAAGATLAWLESPLRIDPLLLPRQKTLLTRALRECLSNSLKHADCCNLQIELRTALSPNETFIFECSDNGQTSNPEQWIKGRGIKGLEQRLQEMGGTVAFRHKPPGNSVTVRLLLTNPES